MRDGLRAYRWLLSAYPRHWRARFGPDMCEAFASEYAQVRPRGLLSRATFWIVTAAQAVWFGLVERVLRGGTVRSMIATDWRAAYRALRASPAISALAIASLAFGIGANTALFSILNSLVFKPLPVHEPSRLYLLDQELTNPLWEQIRQRQEQLDADLLAYSTEPFHVSLSGPAEPVTGAYVSGGLFEVLGLELIAGRPLTTEDDVRRGGRDGAVTIISHRYWVRQFGGRPDVVGRAIVIDRVPFTIVGITGPAFNGLDVGAAWDVMVPIAAQAALRGAESSLDSRTSWWLHAMARLRPGQTPDGLTAALRAAQPVIREATIPERWSGIDQRHYLTDPMSFTPAVTGRSPLRSRYSGPLTAILVVVGAVLLIACANIANLLLARAIGRRHEMNVRLALGASRARLVRQLFAESAMLSVAGAVVGLLVAAWGGALLVGQLSTYANAVFLDLSLDWRVLAFTAIVTVGTAVLFGSAPAFSVGHLTARQALGHDGRGILGERHFGLRQTLIVVQVALSLALVVAAGLFLRTLTSLTRVPLGFDPQRLLVAELELPPVAIDAAARWASFERLRDAAAAVPGVAGVAVSHLTPISDSGWNAFVEVPDGVPLPRTHRLDWVNPISPGWFNTYGMRLVAGRDFTDRDRTGQPMVIIVNEAFVRRRIGAGQPAVGRRITGAIEGPSANTSYEIVGVVNDAVYSSPRDGAEATMYVPMAQLRMLEASLSLTVRAAGSVTPPLARRVAEALHRADRDAAVTLRPIDEQIRASMTQERLIAMLAGFFGALALLMAALGIYGITASWVHRRRSEIGLRLALGADPGSVQRLVLGTLGWLVLAGIAIGAAISLWASKFVGALLFNLSPRDPVTFLAAAGVLLLVALTAGWLPARRAARVDPVEVLRAQ